MRSNIFIILIFNTLVLAQSISIISPTEGDTLIKGSTYNISWQKPSFADNGSLVQISIFKYYDNNRRGLKSFTSMDSTSYNWTVPYDYTATPDGYSSWSFKIYIFYQNASGSGIGDGEVNVVDVVILVDSILGEV